MNARWIILAVALLAACSQAPQTYKPAPLDFSSQPPINLNVAEVRLTENYHTATTRPNVEQDFPTPPAAAVKQWLKQRVHAVGTQGVFEVVIDDASVKEVKLHTTGGLKGLFTNDQDARYDANLKVSFRLYDGVDAMSVASGDVIITRSKTIAQDATVNDRTKLYENMTKEMMASFDTEATNRLHQYFANYLK